MMVQVADLLLAQFADNFRAAAAALPEGGSCGFAGGCAGDGATGLPLPETAQQWLRRSMPGPMPEQPSQPGRLHSRPCRRVPRPPMTGCCSMKRWGGFLKPRPPSSPFGPPLCLQHREPRRPRGSVRPLPAPTCCSVTAAAGASNQPCACSRPAHAAAAPQRDQRCLARVGLDQGMVRAPVRSRLIAGRSPFGRSRPWCSATARSTSSPSARR